MRIRDVFLSHNSEDKYYVFQLAEHLRRSNLTIWFDKEEIHGGSNISDKIQEAVMHSATAIVCVGESGLGDWQKLELDSLQTLAVKKRINIITLMLPQVSELPDTYNHLFLQTSRYLQWKTGNPEELEELVDSIFNSLREWSRTELIRLEKQKSETKVKLREIDERISQIKSDFGDELSIQDKNALRWLSSVQKNIRNYILKSLQSLDIDSENMVSGEPAFEFLCINLSTLIEFIDFSFRTKDIQRIYDINIDLSIQDSNLPEGVTAENVYKAIFKAIKANIPVSLIGEDTEIELIQYFDHIETQIFSTILN
jgi:TIR domain